MTFRLLGVPDEIRLEYEQNGGGTTEAARLIIEHAVNQAQQQTELAVREIQSIVGPHGSITRLQAGGLRITPGGGMGVFADGVYKTQIQPNGTFVIGSNIENPVTTTEVFFVEDTIYNNEEFGGGDFLIGDNSTSKTNVKWDASEGEFQFRSGTTVTAYVDADTGAITGGGGDVTMDADGFWVVNQQAAFGFEDTNGDRFKIYLQSDGNDALVLKNEVGGSLAHIRLEADTATNTPLYLIFGESAGNAGVPILNFYNTDDPQTGAALIMGSTSGVAIWAGVDGKETVFNDDSFDINFRVETTSDPHAFYIQSSGNEYASFFGTTAGALVIFDNGPEKRLEIGADHYFPTRDSSNPNGFWNEANQDMDFTFEGVNQSQVSKMDAGLDKYTSINWDGWGMRDEAWTRTGNHTFTVSGDVTAVYRKGTKVRYNDGATEYGVIISSVHAAGTTTITLISNTDYAMANTTINDRYLSYIENPEGFPKSFNYSPATNLGNAVLSSITTATWSVTGGVLHLNITADNKSLSGTAGFIGIALPCTASVVNGWWPLTIYFISSYEIVRTDQGVSQINIYKNMTSGSWTASETGLFLRIKGTITL